MERRQLRSRVLSEKPHCEEVNVDGGMHLRRQEERNRARTFYGRGPTIALGSDPNSAADRVADPAHLFLNHTEPLLPDV